MDLNNQTYIWRVRQLVTNLYNYWLFMRLAPRFINPGNLIFTEAKGRGECKISRVNISIWQPISIVYCFITCRIFFNKHHCIICLRDIMFHHVLLFHDNHMFRNIRWTYVKHMINVCCKISSIHIHQVDCFHRSRYRFMVSCRKVTEHAFLRNCIRCLLPLLLFMNRVGADQFLGWIWRNFCFLL